MSQVKEKNGKEVPRRQNRRKRATEDKQEKVLPKKDQRAKKVSVVVSRNKARNIRKEREDLKITDKGVRSKMTDPRFNEFTKSLSSSNDNSLENPSLTYEVPLQAEALSGGALAAVTFAISRGWISHTPDPSYPYWAYVYLTKLLIGYAMNIVPQVSEVPRWLNVLGNFLMPKVDVQFGSGKATYKFALTNPSYVPGSEIPMGPGEYARYATLYQPNYEGTPINNNLWPMAAPDAYTDDGGEKAWASLCQFLANVHDAKDARSHMHKMVASNLTTKFLRDPSAYANVLPTPGGGFQQTGGYGNQVSLEVPVFSPLVSNFKISSSTSIGDPARYPRYTRTGAGDVMTCVGQLVHILSHKQIQRKAYPFIKCIDFLEFGETLGYYCQAMAEKFCQDPQNIEVKADPITLITPKCPLTLQEALLCLRATMMSAFKDTQFMVQGLFPNLPANSSENKFVAYIAASGTSAYAGTTDMLLPLTLVENIRACTARLNHGGRGGDFNPQAWIPALGQYYDDVLSEDQFVYVGLDDLPTGVFKPTSEAILKKVDVDKTGKPIKIYGAESPVDLVDGTSSGLYYAINDPGTLNTWIQLWNKWIQDMSNFSIPVTTISTDGGVNVLNCISMTDFWTPVFSEGKKKKNIPLRFQVEEKVFDENSPYNTRQIVSTTSHNVIYNAAWESFLQHWIRPTINSSDGTTFATANNYNRIKAFYCEPHALTEVENIAAAGGTLQNKHKKFADLMVKSRNAPKTEFVKMLEECSKKGEGGILSSLVSSLAGPILGKEGAAIAQGIASFLPF